jgi:hypothetical protein
MLILGRLCALALIGLFTVVLLPSIGRSDIRLNKLDREVSPLHGEPQVALDCDTSTLRLEPCGVVSRYLWEWTNIRAYCLDAAYSAALNGKRSAHAATIFCNIGIYSDRRTRPNGRWSQHRYRRACDGDRIVVDAEQFNYLDAVKAHRSGAKGRDPHYRFFTTFLDCWGTVGPGTRPDGGLTLDFNRGVRDWREDPGGHSGHFHLSKPCLICSFGEMAYE